MSAPSFAATPTRGRFFVLDGVDGCGKSTQARRLVQSLDGLLGAAQVRAAAHEMDQPSSIGSKPSTRDATSTSEETRATSETSKRTLSTAPALLAQALHLREPGSTDLGEKLRTILLSRGPHITPRVETLLFAAARAQMLAELVEPALAAGRHVVCERFHPSTFAYQAVAGGLPEREVLDLLEQWAGEPKPDLVILLTLPPEVAARRRGRATDRIEDKGLEFQRRVALGYARYAELAKNCVSIDGSRDEAMVARDVFAEVQRALR